MLLTFNPTQKQFEFRCGSAETDASGKHGNYLASTAQFKASWETGPTGHKRMYWHTVDPRKAAKLIDHVDPKDTDLRNTLLSQAFTPGLPQLTCVNGCYVWLDNKSGLQNQFPVKAGFVFARDPYAAMPRSAGASFDSPVFWTEDVEKAIMCSEYADQKAQTAIADALTNRHKDLEASRAEDSDIVIPCPPGIHPGTLQPYEYKGFQRGSVAYGSTRTRVGFFDEMGLGKTIQAIAWINWINGTTRSKSGRVLKRILVVCPASLKRNWQIELQRWLYLPYTVGIADSSLNFVIPDTEIVICNYDILGLKSDTPYKIEEIEFVRIIEPGTTKYKSGKIVQRSTAERTNAMRKPANRASYAFAFKKEKKHYRHFLRDKLRVMWDMVIGDEIHLCKGDPKQVIRSQLFFSLKAHYWALLSGTPMVNRPREMWNFAHHMAPHVFDNQAQYLARFCAGKGYDGFDGGQSLPELQRLLRSSFMVRRLKSQVLKDLPPKMRQIIELPATGCEKLVREESFAFDQRTESMAELRLRVELAKASDDPADYTRSVGALREAIEVGFEDLSRVRKETGLAKIPVVCEHIERVLEEQPKVIVGGHHKAFVMAIADHFGKDFVFMHGDIPPHKRQPIVEKFQTDPDVRGIVGNYGTMGVGHTLTASSYVIIAEWSWVPSDVLQLEDRAHRIGQKDCVTVQHLVLAGSIESRMVACLVEKQQMADLALDSDEKQMILADPIGFEKEKVATLGVTPKEIERLAGQMSPEEISAVGRALRFLADEQLFRHVDAAMGNLLAERRALTPKLAALGRKFIKPYERYLTDLDVTVLFPS